METDPDDFPMEPEEAISVLDADAFANKHMPDLGHVVKEYQAFHWDLQGWRGLDKKLYSPEFDCNGHKWRILLFPFGNTAVFPPHPNTHLPPNAMVSFYLDCAGPEGRKEGWHVCAQFALVISNPHDPTNYIVSHAHHRFTSEEPDWGFTRFCELHKLLQCQPGQSRPRIEGESTTISAYVRVLEDPTGVLWHNFIDYDSKKATGYVGLKNQGATGYINSLVQSLFCTHYFRKAVYQIPTEDEDPAESVPLALQRVFYHLQTSDQSVGTVELTRSFGWSLLDSHSQHDVQEFNRVLQDTLESRMKGTRAEGSITKLFAGKMKSFTKCLHVDYESSRIEEFYDIQLNVKGMRTLYDSFRDYVGVEMLSGENKYRAEGFELQDARKGIIFQSLPPVLHLQLKRYEYDMQLDAMVKINDRFEYPFEIDLGEFLDETADRSAPWKYKLHGVLVHCGTSHAGVYSTLIKPGRDARWLRFDDDRVTPVTDNEVLEENYGGEPLLKPALKPLADRVKPVKRSINAYMLVYIRDSAIDEVLAPLAEEDTPSHLKRRIDEERAQVENKKEDRDEQGSSLTVKLVTDRTFARHEDFDLAVFDEKSWPLSDLPTFQVPCRETYKVFKSRVAKRFGYPEKQIRLWVLVTRQNQTVRVDTHIPENDPSLTIEEINNDAAVRPQDLRLYLDFQPGPSMKNESENAGTIMIFLKHFDTARQAFCGVGKIHVQRRIKVRSLIPIINKRMRWTLGTSLKLYEEVKPGMVELMKPAYTLAQSEIQDGDIICFQAELSDAEIRQLEAQGMYSNPLQFYDYLHDRVMVLFKPKFGDPEVDQPEFSLVLSRRQNYGAMATRVGEHLKHESIKLRFTTTCDSDGAPKSILKRSLNQRINEMISPSSVASSRTVILYEKLYVSIAKLENKRTLKVVWVGIYNREESTHLFLVSRISRVYDLIEHLSKRVHLTPTGTGRIRVFEIVNGGRNRMELSGSEMIWKITGPDPVELFAEEIPWDEMDVEAYCKIVNVFHFHGDISRTHGVPFKFVADPGERFSETKERLRYRLGISEEDFSRFGFALVRMGPQRRLSYFRDSDIIYWHVLTQQDYLGLNHADNTGKVRGIGGIKFGAVRSAEEPVELFAEEIPRDVSGAEDPDDIMNVSRFTRDVARTHGISYKFGFPPGVKGLQSVRNSSSGDLNVK